MLDFFFRDKCNCLYKCLRNIWMVHSSYGCNILLHCWGYDTFGGSFWQYHHIEFRKYLLILCVNHLSKVQVFLRATKIWKILPLVVTLLSKRQNIWTIFSNFCGFLKMSLVEFNYRYFKHLEITHLKKPMTASLSISPMFILHSVPYLI